MLLDLGIETYRNGARKWSKTEARRKDGRIASFGDDLVNRMKNIDSSKRRAYVEAVVNSLLTRYIQTEISFCDACVYDAQYSLNGTQKHNEVLDENYKYRASAIATACSGIDGLRARLLELSFDEVAHVYHLVMSNTSDPSCNFKMPVAKNFVLNADEIRSEIIYFAKWK